MKTIDLYPLKRGEVALVDDADYEWVSRFHWHLGKNGYVFRITGSGSQGTQQRYYLHRELLKLTDPLVEGEHRDNDPLNNQRFNLRPATHAQNLRNRGKQLNGKSSRFKGVYWNEAKGKWQAQIGACGHRSLGRFSMEEDAARAYNAAATRLHGPFAKLNEL